MVTILIMSAKMATPGLYKMKAFLKKGYEVTISTITSPKNFYLVI